MEEQESKFLGLTKRQSLFGFFFSAIVHTFTSAYSVYSNVTLEQFKELSSKEIDAFYAWYIYYPTLFICFFFLSRFSDYVLKDGKYKSILGFIFSIVIGVITITLLRVLFLLILYWNQI